jgi:ferredoxin--NADP+ reductase
MKADELNAVVTLVNRISPWLMVLQVVPGGWTFPDFTPGQYLTIGLPGSAARCSLAEPEPVQADPEHILRRAYCIASSAANREFLEFYIHLVPHGALTPRLFALKIGDRVSLTDRVTGAFTFDHVPEDANVVLIATGTGLAPYVSMISTHLRFGAQRRVALVHGVRNSWELGYRSILMTMQHLRTNVTYLPVVSRPAYEPTRWNGATGHVQEVWKGRAVEEAWGRRPTPDDTHVFLSGSPHMIDDMAALFAEEGYREHMDRGPGQIHIERYWLASPTVSHSDQTATLDSSARRREPAASGTAKETAGVMRAKDEEA